MGTFIIFCAAEFDALAAPIGAEDFILAADGGLRHLEKLHIAPHGILGDFDSLVSIKKLTTGIRSYHLSMYPHSSQRERPLYQSFLEKTTLKKLPMQHPSIKIITCIILEHHRC